MATQTTVTKASAAWAADYSADHGAAPWAGQTTGVVLLGWTQDLTKEYPATTEPAAAAWFSSQHQAWLVWQVEKEKATWSRLDIRNLLPDGTIRVDNPRRVYVRGAQAARAPRPAAAPKPAATTPAAEAPPAAAPKARKPAAAPTTPAAEVLSPDVLAFLAAHPEMLAAAKAPKAPRPGLWARGPLTLLVVRAGRALARFLAEAPAAAEAPPAAAPTTPRPAAPAATTEPAAAPTTPRPTTARPGTSGVLCRACGIELSLMAAQGSTQCCRDCRKAGAARALPRVATTEPAATTPRPAAPGTCPLCAKAPVNALEGYGIICGATDCWATLGRWTQAPANPVQAKAAAAMVAAIAKVEASRATPAAEPAAAPKAKASKRSSKPAATTEPAAAATTEPAPAAAEPAAPSKPAAAPKASKPPTTPAADLCTAKGCTAPRATVAGRPIILCAEHHAAAHAAAQDAQAKAHAAPILCKLCKCVPPTPGAAYCMPCLQAAAVRMEAGRPSIPAGAGNGARPVGHAAATTPAAEPAESRAAILRQTADRCLAAAQLAQDGLLVDGVATTEPAPPAAQAAAWDLAAKALAAAGRQDGAKAAQAKADRARARIVAAAEPAPAAGAPRTARRAKAGRLASVPAKPRPPRRPQSRPPRRPPQMSRRARTADCLS
jgi:hypothetical protein